MKGDNMFEQIFKQSKEIKLIPDGHGNFEIICKTDLKDRDKEETFEAEFTFPKVRLNISLVKI